MPQASDELRNLMKKWFGHPVNMDGPYKLLMSHGFTDEGGLLHPPVPSYQLSNIELECIWFLMDEWDYDYEPGNEPYVR
jgi:hypothetical protein